MRGSLNASQSNTDSNFKSVGEQSGIKAGNGGFNVTVNNNTDLKGAVIASNQSVVDNNKNTFTTSGALSTSDLQNSASYSANKTSLASCAGYGGSTTSLNGLGIGLGSDKRNANSTTTAGRR